MSRDISQDPTTARTLQGAGHVEIQNISRRGFLGVSGTAFALALFPAPTLVGSDRSQICTMLGQFKHLFPNLPPSLARTSLTCNCVCLVPTGEGLGLAVHRSFVSYVASCVHVKIVDGQVTVPTVHTAIDCGFAANPERIRS